MPEEIMVAIVMVLLAVFGLMVPMVAILTKHQQKMAEIINRNRAAESNPRLDTLEREMADLKDILHQQAIAMDNLISLQTRMTLDAQQRIEQSVGRNV